MSVEDVLAEIVACDELVNATYSRRNALYDQLAQQIKDAGGDSGTAMSYGDYTVLVDTAYRSLACARYKVVRTTPLPTQLVIEHAG